MSQSLTNIIIHIVFSTRNREHILPPEITPKLYGFMAKLLQNRGCQVFKIAGISNHVHILCLMSKKYTIEDIIKEIKTSSSKWLKTQGDGFANFHWQRGYGVFSINAANKEMIINYIANQGVHHQKYDFKNELRALLHKNHVAYDERFIWND
jgi:putative transposase